MRVERNLGQDRAGSAAGTASRSTATSVFTSMRSARPRAAGSSTTLDSVAGRDRAYWLPPEVAVELVLFSVDGSLLSPLRRGRHVLRPGVGRVRRRRPSRLLEAGLHLLHRSAS